MTYRSINDHRLTAQNNLIGTLRNAINCMLFDMRSDVYHMYRTGIEFYVVFVHYIIHICHMVSNGRVSQLVGGGLRP